MKDELRNVTEEEAAILLRLAKDGIHPTELDARMRDEIELRRSK